MARLFLVVWLVLLLALPGLTVDWGHGSSVAWESDDETVASTVFEAGSTAQRVVVVAVPVIATNAAPSGDGATPRRQSLPPAPGRAPPAC